MMAHPGKKLMFMGSEIGQFDEWNADKQIEWELLEYEKHRQLNHFFAVANKFYRDTPAMHENDYNWDGFQWIALDDYKNSIIAFRRIAYDGSEIICVCNFQPVIHENYKIGVPKNGIYEEVLNSEASEFGGCGITNSGEIKSKKEPDHELDYSIDITIPPLGVMYFKMIKEIVPAKRNRKKKTEVETPKTTAESKTTKAESADEKTAGKKTTAKKSVAKKTAVKKTAPKKIAPKKPTADNAETEKTTVKTSDEKPE